MNVVENEIDRLPEGWIVLIEAKIDDILNLELDLVKHVTKNYKTIVISATKPHAELLDLYKKHGIDENNVFIIDCVPGLHETHAQNVVMIGNISDLNKISISITECMRLFTGKKVVLIDSITKMLAHNDPHTFARFIHSMLTKMRMNGTSGILLSVDGEMDKEVRAEIAQLCDRVIKT